MGSIFGVGLLGGITFVLLLIASWQRRLTEQAYEAAADDLAEAHERGTHQAIAQHPIIQPWKCIGCGTCIEACPEEGVLALVDGVARVVHGSRCIGHGLCAEACPVDALTVGLGELADSPDMPVLSDALETSVPGVYMAGELGGFALIRHALDQGQRVITEIARSSHLKRRSPDAVDVLIVGSGPAGLSATLKAVELGLSYRTIDMSDLGGTVRKYPRRKLTLIQAVELPLYGKLPGREYMKEEVIEIWEQIVRDYGLKIQTGVRFLGADRDGDAFVAKTSSGEVRTRTIVLALGRRGTPRKLGVKGEEREKVLYQLVDAATYENQRILVVGGGDSAIEAAVALAAEGRNEVALSYRKDGFFRLKPKNEKRLAEAVEQGRVHLLLSSQVTRIGRTSVTVTVREKAPPPAPQGSGGGARTPDGQRVLRFANDFVFVFAGGEPPFPLLKSMGIRFGGAGDPVASGAARKVVTA